jgi:peptide/nickel transport system ATP-binding protein
MATVPAHQRHYTRCARFSEIDWQARPEVVEAAASANLGEVVLRVENMKKYYELRDTSLMAMISGRSVRTVKAPPTMMYL